MEKKDLYLSDEALYEMVGLEHYCDDMPTILSVSKASADYAAKKLFEELGISYIASVNVRDCCQLCGTQVFIDTERLKALKKLIET